MITEKQAEPRRGVRIVFQLTVDEQDQERFLAAYDRICADVAGVDGHLVDQVCQSLADPRDWMITSEWVSIDHFLAWEHGPGHSELAGPLVAATRSRQSRRYLVCRETRTAGVGGAGSPDPVSSGSVVASGGGAGRAS